MQFPFFLTYYHDLQHVKTLYVDSVTASSPKLCTVHCLHNIVCDQGVFKGCITLTPLPHYTTLCTGFIFPTLGHVSKC